MDAPATSVMGRGHTRSEICKPGTGRKAIYQTLLFNDVRYIRFKFRLRLLLPTGARKPMARQRSSRCNFWTAIVHNADSPFVFDDLGAAVRSGSLLLAANSVWEVVGAIPSTELLPGSASIFDSLKDRIA